MQDTHIGEDLWLITTVFSGQEEKQGRKEVKNYSTMSTIYMHVYNADRLSCHM